MIKFDEANKLIILDAEVATTTTDLYSSLLKGWVAQSEHETALGLPEDLARFGGIFWRDCHSP
jgi:hypothetical protein